MDAEEPGRRFALSPDERDLGEFVEPNAGFYIYGVARGSRGAFGWSAFLADVGWLVHRKLYAEAGAIVLLAAAVLSALPAAWPAWVLVKLALGVWGPRYYVRVARTRLAAAVARADPSLDQPRVVQAAGGVGPGGWLVGLPVNAAVIVLAVLSWWSPSPPRCDDLRVQQAVVGLARDRLRVPEDDYFRTGLIAISQSTETDAQWRVCIAHLVVGDGREYGTIRYALPADQGRLAASKAIILPDPAMPATFEPLLRPPSLASWSGGGAWHRLVAAMLVLAPSAAFALLLARHLRRRVLDDGLSRAFGAGVLAIPALMLISIPFAFAAADFFARDWWALARALVKAGLAEEAAKLYALLRFALPAGAAGSAHRARWIGAGAALGLGFAIIENLSYAFSTGGLGEATFTALSRAATSLPEHVALGVIMGAMCWRLRARRERGRFWWWPALAAASLAHALYDFPLLALADIPAPLGLGAIGPSLLEYMAAATLAVTVLITFALVLRSQDQGDAPLARRDAPLLAAVAAMAGALAAWIVILAEDDTLHAGATAIIAAGALAPVLAAVTAAFLAWRAWRAEAVAVP